MKLLNINISIKIDNSGKVADFINSQNADIVALQEIIRHLEDKVFDQYRSKSDIEAQMDINYPYKFFAPLFVSDAIRYNGKVHMDFGGHIEQGSEIMSKHPIVRGTNEFFYKHYSYEIDWTNWKNEDTGRSLQMAELNVDGKKLQIFNLHGIWTHDKLGDKRTIAECKYIVEAASRQTIPTIIVGDFNLLPQTKSIKLLNKKFRNLINEYGVTSTRPDFDDGRDKGSNVVDYIFINNQIKVNNFEVINTDISDHLPLLLDFEII